MELLIGKFAEYGLQGLAILGLAWYLHKLTNDHKIERKEWTVVNKDNTDKFAQCIEKNSEALTSMRGELKENRCKMP